MSSIVTFDSFSTTPFDIDAAVEQQLSERQIALKQIEAKTCPLFLSGFCTKTSLCQGRHSKGVDGEVCKHWVRGLCKKGDDCEYLHQYDMAKMPLCQFYSKTGECAKGDDCPFLHLDVGNKVTICPWYKRGFCRNGADCKNTHKREELCPRYLTGFCFEGPDCPLAHPKFDLMINEDAQVALELAQQDQYGNMSDNNHNNNNNKSNMSTNIPQQQGPGGKVVTCHKCGQQGHYANVCPMGKGKFMKKQ